MNSFLVITVDGVPTQVPTVKWPRRAEGVNAKMEGRSTPSKAKKGVVNFKLGSL